MAKVKDLCSSCEKREYCTELCKEAEEYVNQDYVPQREYVSPSAFNGGLCNFRDIEYPECRKSERRIIYELYFLDKRPVEDIAYHVSYSTAQIYNIINQLKNNIDSSNLVRDKILKLHFVEEKPYAVIIEECNTDKYYLTRVIQTYLRKNGVK